MSGLFTGAGGAASGLARWIARRMFDLQVSGFSVVAPFDFHGRNVQEVMGEIYELIGEKLVSFTAEDIGLENTGFGGRNDNARASQAKWKTLVVGHMSLIQRKLPAGVTDFIVAIVGIATSGHGGPDGPVMAMLKEIKERAWAKSNDGQILLVVVLSEDDDLRSRLARPEFRSWPQNLLDNGYGNRVLLVDNTTNTATEPGHDRDFLDKLLANAFLVLSCGQDVASDNNSGADVMRMLDYSGYTAMSFSVSDLKYSVQRFPRPYWAPRVPKPVKRNPTLWERLNRVEVPEPYWPPRGPEPEIPEPQIVFDDEDAVVQATINTVERALEGRWQTIKSEIPKLRNKSVLVNLPVKDPQARGRIKTAVENYFRQRGVRGMVYIWTDFDGVMPPGYEWAIQEVDGYALAAFVQVTIFYNVELDEIDAFEEIYYLDEQARRSSIRPRAAVDLDDEGASE